MSLKYRILMNKLNFDSLCPIYWLVSSTFEKQINVSWEYFFF